MNEWKIDKTNWKVILIAQNILVAIVGLKNRFLPLPDGNGSKKNIDGKKGFVELGFDLGAMITIHGSFVIRDDKNC